jgi:hypothetical protein
MPGGHGELKCSSTFVNPDIEGRWVIGVRSWPLYRWGIGPKYLLNGRWMSPLPGLVSVEEEKSFHHLNLNLDHSIIQHIA